MTRRSAPERDVRNRDCHCARCAWWLSAAAQASPRCCAACAGTFPHPGESAAATSAIADLAAVVTVTDDGGSSGRLRQDFNMLPPGDLRNCMVALSEEEDLLAQLFTHRFRAGDALKGHNFGNLFVAALTEITGDFAQAVQLASKILATRGRIYPATTANATLVANMDDGSVVRGETKITASKRRIVELTLDPPNPAPCRRRWRRSSAPT